MVNVKTKAIGVDIATSSVKVAEVVKTRKGLVLKNYAETTIPVSALVAGVIRQPDNVREALQKCLDRFGVRKGKKQYAVCTIPDDKVYTQEGEFPNLIYEKLKEAIQFKIQTFIPLPLTEVYWDFQIISHNKNTNTVKVIIAAAAKETVDSYYGVIKSVGLIPISFESSSMSSLRLIPKSDTEDSILLDIGKTQTTISLANSNVITFNSTIHTGLNQVIKEYGEFFNVDDDKSLQIIKETGLAVKNAELREKVKTLFETITSEVKKTINFESGDGIKHIYLFGEGSLLKGVQDILKIDKEITPEPLVFAITLPDTIELAKIVPVAGAAVKQFEKTIERRINFLPDNASKEITNSIIKDKFVLVLRVLSINMIAYIVVFLILGVFLIDEQSLLNQKLTSIKSSVQTNTYTKVNTQIGQYNTQLSQISMAQQSQTDWLPFLKEIASTVPSGITLSSYDITPATPTGWTVSISGSAPSRNILLTYVNILEYDSKYLSGVSIPISYLQSNQSVTFTINASVATID